MIEKGEEFMWYKYLEASKTEAIPDEIFPHVEQSIQSGISLGMALEVPVKSENSKECYWVAKVTMACGPLLELQYFSHDNKTKKFWFNLTKETGHELGWCYKNSKQLLPPDDCLISSNSLDKLESFIRNAVSVPADMLSGEAINKITKIKKGMKVEISDPLSPYKLWMATIIENVGGRLLLRYDTPGSPVKDFWTFCTSDLLHDYGFIKKCSSPWFLDPPSSIKDNHSSDEWIDFVKSYLIMNNPVCNNLFINEEKHSKHEFKVGMKLEAVSPHNCAKICPATVTSVIDDTYFLVSVDESLKDCEKNANLCNDTSKTWLCTIDHPYIFPKNWAKQHNIKLIVPAGWTNSGNYFNWDSYLKETNSIAADDCLFYKRESASELGYKTGSRLEAIDPLNKFNICVARITRVIDDLLFIKLDSEEARAAHIVHIHSPEIFPVGWCGANQYPLRLPRDYKNVLKKAHYKEELLTGRNTNLTKIYFNTRCSTGPMISKSKLIGLPKSVGPGPVDLVLTEVLTMLVSVGYNSGRVLKVLQCDAPLEPGYNIEMLKVKQKNGRYHARVAVVNNCKMVEEFCRNVCKKINVCPNLFGPLYITDKDQCPEKCRKSRGRGKWIRKRGRQANKDKNTSTNGEREGEREDESSASDASHQNPEGSDTIEDSSKTASNSSLKDKLDNSDEIKNEPVTSDTSESSNNERLKRKEINGDNSTTKSLCLKENTNSKAKKKKQGLSAELTEFFDYIDPDYVEIHKKKRRPKTLKLESNPLYWTVEEVFNYLKKTNDCKDIAHIIKKEEIDGMAFLLLNLPSLIQHMKLSQCDALKLCRHIEQVKVTYFLKHINDPAPEQ